MNFFLSSDCIKIFSLAELNLKISEKSKFEASINLKFFFFFKILRASSSILFPIITSKNNLLISNASFLFILKLQETIPPKALNGSQARADL